MKEGHNRTRIDAGDIGPLVQIATMTSYRESARIVRAPMLLGYDVFDVVSEFAIALAHEAVFTAVLCPAPDKFPRSNIHR